MPSHDFHDDEPNESRYLIGDIVAEGAMGVVRRARERSTGRDVAMKQIRAELADGSGAAAARFLQEAKITAHLEHPNGRPRLDEKAAVSDVSALAECVKLNRIQIPPTVKNLEVLRKLPSLQYLSYRFDFSTQRPAQTTAQFWAEFDRQKATPPK